MKSDILVLTDNALTSSLLPFRVHPTPDQLCKIREYVQILLKWNRSLSLTTVVDPIEMVTRHFGESMYLGSLLPVDNCRLADVGTGAGFPGLALKIICPNLAVVLIESNRKKCAFLLEIVRALQLASVEVRPMRFEDIRIVQPEFEIVTARAIGGIPELLNWSQSVLVPRGHISLWLGGEDTTKISAIESWIWKPAIRIPEAQRRFILIGRPRPDSAIGS